jgi:O-methyltransferase
MLTQRLASRIIAKGLTEVLDTPLRHAFGPALGWVERQKRKHRRLSYNMIPQRAFRAVLRRGWQELIERIGTTELGDYLEFGVHSCSSLVYVYKELESLSLTQVRLFGFDSFQGLPESARTDDRGAWLPGQFQCDYRFARQILEDERIDPNRVSLIPGWFSDSLTPTFIEKAGITKASVIMVDCDMYLSANEALTFCGPLIKDVALILFDDWHAYNDLAAVNLGERRAFDEFLSAQGCFGVERLASYTTNAEVFMVSRQRP